MASDGRLDVGMAEVAAAAGVSRQTLFHAVGSRPGLLVAMVRHRDSQAPQMPRLVELARGDGADLATLLEFTDTWLDYLPAIYPVAIQLEMASISDRDVAMAWTDRFISKGLLRGFAQILGRMASRSALPPGSDPAQLADLCLALVAPSAWRLLVVDRGWSPAVFRASRHALMSMVMTRPPGTQRSGSAPGRR
jgi:AcrR family transcriptional regulator